MQTTCTQTPRGSQRRAARLVIVALVAALLSLSLAGIAVPRAHAATRQADDAVQQVACDGHEELDLFYSDGAIGLPDLCYSGTGHLGLGSNAVPNVNYWRYNGSSDSGWLRVYDAYGGYWQNLRLRGEPFSLPVLVTQICLNCGLHPLDGIQRIGCDDPQLILNVAVVHNVCFAGTGYLGLGDPGGPGDLAGVTAFDYSGSTDSWLLYYDASGGHFLNIGPYSSNGSHRDFESGVLVTQVCLNCGDHS